MIPSSSESLNHIRTIMRYRSFGVLSGFTKKAKEAAESTKKAAEKLGESTGVDADKLRQQAAAAVSQAQGLAKETMDELLKNAKGSQSKNDTSGNVTKGESTSSTGESGSGAAADRDEQKEGKGREDRKPESGANMMVRLRGTALAVLNEMKAVVLPETSSASALRGAAAKAGEIKTSDSSALMMSAAPEEARWQQQWRQWSDSLGSHPFFRSVASIKDSKVVSAGRDVAESIRERWETSDSPFVHRIQDATDAFFSEGEAATAIREIRSRDPSFDMVNFLKLLRGDVPLVIGAYLRGDEEEIAAHCTPEMVERLTGIIKAQKASGLVPDPTLLDNSDVELVDVKMLDDSPIIVVQFTCQQINCTRDSLGNVVEGAPDEVHRVYYYWALQQEPTGYVGEDGATHPPRWQLREMLIRGMHHLL